MITYALLTFALAAVGCLIPASRVLRAKLARVCLPGLDGFGAAILALTPARAARGRDRGST